MSDDAKNLDNGSENAGTESAGTESAGTESAGTEPYLGSWATKEDAAEGLKNLQTKLSEQGNESGLLRKQVEESKALIEEMQGKLSATEKAAAEKANARKGEELVSEQAKISKQISDLDPVDDGYSAKLMSLINKSNALAAKEQHSKTLESATEAFRKELDSRDIKSAHATFYKENPDFSTPEMQAQIKEYIGRDATGMSDPLSAYREIQRDSAMLQAKELSEQNAELMKRLELKQGTDETGTVITKSQSTEGAKSKQPKTKGADRDMAMMNILKGM